MTGLPVGDARGHALATRERFVAEVRHACEQRSAYASGRLAGTELDWLRYPLVLERERDPLKLHAIELVLAHKSLRGAGVFPATPSFYRRWVERFIEDVAQLDSIGIMRSAVGATLALLAAHALDLGPVIDLKDQQPDRSMPSVDSRCYLPALAGRDVLLVCPFAGFLAERVTRETFEAVWAKTGKRWFAPRSVDALEFPYGFMPDTQRRFGTALDLLEHLQAELTQRRYDVALIAAGGLGIPLACFVKSQGRVGLSLGGHLQVLFGVLGARWREKESWRRRYFNDAWVGLPSRYVPPPGHTFENYW